MDSNLIIILIFTLILCKPIQLADWTTPQMMKVQGYPGTELMEPFLSRDGKWLFFNSRNVGNNITLHYASLRSPVLSFYMGQLGGDVNGPVPHLDAVASMDNKNNFFWISTRGYPENIQNVMTGRFQNGMVPKASHLPGDFYILPTNDKLWIIMDQEVNEDGSILFFCNAAFKIPPGSEPMFSNISIALRSTNGTYLKHPNAEAIMKNVNNLFGSNLKFAPSSLGVNSNELYFTARRTGDPKISAIYVAKRNGRDDVFGEPVEVPTSTQDRYLEPEAPTISRDGKLMMFNRIDCGSKSCTNINLYSISRA